MNTYVPILRDLDARGGRKLRTDTHTNTRDNYSNPRCAHARRGLINNGRAERKLLGVAFCARALDHAIFFFFFFFGGAGE